MSDTPGEASRIILPGGGKPGGLVGPDGRPVSSAPEPEPGEAKDGLPTHPRLRALEIQEASEGGRSFLVLIDPSGVAPEAIAVAAEVLPILMLLDGSMSLADLVAFVDRETGDPRSGKNVRTLVEELDRRLMLESPRFFAARDEARAAWRAEPVRPAVLAGASYPAEPAEITAFLDGFDTTARSWRDGVEAAPGVPAEKSEPRTAAPRALAAPHIDLRRGGAVTARAFLELDGLGADALPDVVFVYGTGHGLLEETYAITGKTYATPLGDVPAHADAVRWIEEACGPWISLEEIAHRDEHSIEFQALLLRHRYGTRRVAIVPLLCGGFHGFVRYERRPSEDEKVEALIAATAAAASRLERDGVRVMHLAGIDLSHVGARFGDAVDMDQETLASVEQHDRAALSAALTGDAEAWFDAIARHGDSTRICGFAALYTMLRVAQVRQGRLLAYEPSVEDTGSVVTYASLTWG